MKTIFPIVLFLIFTLSISAQIGIDNPSPDAKALVDMQSTNKGLLIPRVTTGERIALGSGAPESLMVYDTELHAFFFYHEGWKCITPWTLTIATASTPMPDMNSNNALLDGIGINDNPAAGEKLAIGGNVRVTGSINAASLNTSGAITSSTNITASGNLLANGFASDGGEGVSGPVVTGIVVMWSGPLASFDGTGKGVGTMKGWALCNGNNGTPNLQGRFVVGYNPADGEYNSFGLTGGAKTVTLTESQMPSHNHTGSTSTDGNHYHDVPAGDMGNSYDYEDDGRHPAEWTWGGTTSWSGTHSHSLTIANRGGGAAHENRPPYYVLAYIKKL